LEARGRIELPIKVLQTFALPLGDRAFGRAANFDDGIRAGCDGRQFSFSRYVCGSAAFPIK
jgi:hypothetical protein